ncbi:UNVERIFIED_ORG: 8-oxo-dGTP pyrophosphatase MutT (NUDIX family) [Rhizobium etli]
MAEIAIGALIGNGSVLLVRRSSERRTHPDRWSLPGGHVEDGEDAETALRRELLEEIGVTPQHWLSAGEFVSESPPGAFATSVSITSTDGRTLRDLSAMNTRRSDGLPPRR